MNKFYKFIFIFLMIFPLFPNENNGNNYIEEANRLYIKGDFESAFSKINQYFYIVENSFSDKSLVLGEKIYYYYLRSLFSSNRFVGVEFIEKTLNQNSKLKSDRVLRAFKMLKETEDEIADLIETEEDYENFDFLFEYEESSSNYSNEELTQLLKNSLLEGEKSEEKVSKVTILLISLIAFIFILSISIIIYIFKISNSSSKSARRSLSPVLIGISKESLVQFNSLLSDCKRIGTEIDIVTGRKNNSINCAELVYKISIEKGLSENDAILFYAASLVHDIGLLGINRDILQKDVLDSREFEQIKKHTLYGEEALNFIPEKYKKVFIDATNKHHENLDGSGYPYGIKGNDIPYIARVLRIVESFISQVSVREYKDISDKETAVKHLIDEPQVYDVQLVNLLSAVI